MIPRRMAASATVRHNGPAVSWVCEMGMMPARLSRPTVGLMPTIPVVEAGHTNNPSVSVPTAPRPKLADTTPAESELEPQGFPASAKGDPDWPPPAPPPPGEDGGHVVRP